MKKYLITAVLILAVLTSLTAGTLAAYNKTLPVTGDIRALYFDFTATGIQGFEKEIVDLSPGKSQLYSVIIKNLSDVPVKFNAQKAISGGLSGVLVSEWLDTPYAPPTNPDDFTLASGGTTTLQLKVTWDYQGAPDANTRDCNLGANQITGRLTVNVNGSYT